MRAPERLQSRKARRWVWILVASVVMLMLFAGATTAHAHAIVVRTEPVDGATLANAPDQVRLWFNEPILLDFATFELVDTDGKRISVHPTRSDAGSLFLVVIRLPALAPNAYRLSWKAVSSGDLHVSSGSIVFGIQHAADLAPVGATTNAPQPFQIAWRWLNFGALATLIGALALAFLVLSPRGKPAHALQVATRRRALWLALAACALAFSAGIGLALIQSRAAGDNWQQIILESSYGARVLARQSCLLALGAAIVLVLKRTDQVRAAARVLVLGLVLALVSADSLTSHAVGANDPLPVTVVVNTLHLLAASVWSGGVIALAIAVVPLLRRGANENALALSALRRFGALAAISLAVLIATGLYNTGQQVASLDALLMTLYGQTLLVKLGLILLVALAALINTAILHPGIGDLVRRFFRRPYKWMPLDLLRLSHTLLIETIAIVIVLLAAATLGATQPARGPAFDPPSETTEFAPSVSKNAADLFVTLAVKPNRPGQNFISVNVHDTRRPAPAPIERVTVQLLSPADPRNPNLLNAEPFGGGRYQIGGGAINMAGAWNISVIVSRRGLPDARMTVPWTVSELTPAVKPRVVLVSNRPLAPVLTLAAIVVAFLMGGVLVALRLRRRFATRARLTIGQHQLELMQRE